MRKRKTKTKENSRSARRPVFRLTTISLGVFIFMTAAHAQTISIDREVKMLALGDSYTIGESVSVEGRWPHQFMSALRNLGVTGLDPDYIATTGWTTKNLLIGINAFLDEEKTYNLISILIGVNNQYQGLPLDIYEPDLRKIIDFALKKVGQDSSRVFILSIPDYAYTPFGNGNETISREIDEYNAIKKKVAEEYGLPFINITAISREGLDNTSLVASDGLHPSEKQYEMWVESILPNLHLNFTVSADPMKQNAGDRLHIYPNPANSSITINSLSKITRISIHDSLGRKVFDKVEDNMSPELDVSLFLPGIYTLNVLYSNRNVFESERLIIQEK